MTISVLMHNPDRASITDCTEHGFASFKVHCESGEFGAIIYGPTAKADCDYIVAAINSVLLRPKVTP